MSFECPDCFVCRDTGIVHEFLPEFLGKAIIRFAHTPTGEECPVCYEHDFDTDEQRDLTCPYCGTSVDDWYDTLREPRCDDGTGTCPRCCQTFEYDVTRLWTTRKTKKKPRKRNKPSPYV